MQLIKQLLKLVSKQQLLSLALDILWKLLGKVATDALIYVREAEAHTDWDADQKRRYVISCLRAKYADLKNWKWIINLALELAVGKLKGADGAQKSAAILKAG
jgi:hypothetical protein